MTQYVTKHWGLLKVGSVKVPLPQWYYFIHNVLQYKRVWNSGEVDASKDWG